MQGMHGTLQFVMHQASLAEYQRVYAHASQIYVINIQEAFPLFENKAIDRKWLWLVRLHACMAYGGLLPLVWGM